MTEKELLCLLRSDPQRGLAATVDKYSGYVLKIAHTKLYGLCTEEDIEEAVSDIFMAFYTSGRRCGFEIRSLTAYISLIAERHCLNLFRQARRRRETVPFEEVENTFYVETNKTDSSELSEAIKSLGEPDTTIFLRKYFFGQKNSDIAKELGMKTNTVNQRISRGLKKLRKILEEGTR